MGHDKYLPEDFFDLSQAEQEFCHEMAYMEAYGRLSNPLRDAMREKAMGKISKADKDELKTLMIAKGATQGLTKASSYAFNEFVLNRAVAKSIVSATVKGSVDKVGRRAAIIVTQNTVKYSMAAGGMRHLMG